MKYYRYYLERISGFVTPPYWLIYERNTVEFTCTSNGYVSWILNDPMAHNIKIYRKNKNHSILSISNVRLYNAGVYECRGQDNSTLFEDYGTLAVNGRRISIAILFSFGSKGSYNTLKSGNYY